MGAVREGKVTHPPPPCVLSVCVGCGALCARAVAAIMHLSGACSPACHVLARSMARTKAKAGRSSGHKHRQAAKPVAHHVTFVPALSTSIGLPSPQRTAAPGRTAPASEPAPTGSTSAKGDSGSGPHVPPRQRPARRTPRGGPSSAEGAGPAGTGTVRPAPARRPMSAGLSGSLDRTALSATRTMGHSKHHFTAGSAPQVRCALCQSPSTTP